MQSFWECVVGCTCLLCFSWQWLFVNCTLCFEQAKVRNKKHFLLLFSLYLQHQIKLLFYYGRNLEYSARVEIASQLGCALFLSEVGCDISAEDYIKSRHLQFFVSGEPRYADMLNYCRYHNRLSDYEPFFAQWTDEQMCNYAITLCHFIDRMMMSFLKKLEQEFITEGGIKERMHRARTGYRQQQDERLKQLEAELPRLKQALAEAQAEAAKWKAAFEDLKQRALKMYYEKEEEIKRLKELLGEENL